MGLGAEVFRTVCACVKRVEERRGKGYGMQQGSSNPTVHEEGRKEGRDRQSHMLCKVAKDNG